MSGITIYHNPRCSTSRRTLERLEQTGQPIEVIEYLQQPLTVDQLMQVLQQANLSAKDLIRSKESLYQELSLDTADDTALVQAMADHPILMNRPVVVTPKGARLCRPVELVEEIL
ncbi:MAG TPA: arsenate reductase (glutaredoxin) [Candidatus Paenalcaligenes intestinipullorum]|uniref:Arsenate reductase n=1 Tax=Candidatus Paenalcaligenes intestinipullorum TaxID=2838718 RepID=A0A9D2U8S8_9BURK|nr:arsenate reductase (glutaredoxin) [Candidatus Paenalcaligenes intestinipullorum]